MLKKLIFFIFVSSFVLSGCKTIYSNRMLETPSDFKFNELPKVTSNEEFKLAINDLFQFRLFSNDGFKLVDLNINSNSGNQGAGAGGAQQIAYTITPDGTSKLPLLGTVNLSGLTIKQAEDTLEKKFGEFYIKPFVLLTVTSRKIIFFASGEGSARIVPLQGNSISLIEAIAAAGGIPAFGRAFSIKIIRGESRNPLVYKVDLSTLEGYKEGNIILQSNDIVYIDARQGIAARVRNEVTPYLGLVTSLFLTLFYVSRVRNI